MQALNPAVSTSLSSLLETLLGMNYGNPGKGQDPSESIIVSFTADNLQSNFGSGIAYSGVTPTAYEDVVCQIGAPN